jgi:choline kinase
VGLTVGYRKDAIAQEIDRLGLAGRVKLIENALYREGSLISLWVQRVRLRSSRSILLMDGDVLYDRRVIGRLIASTAENVLLVDRHVHPDEEAVKVCFCGGRIVDFGKRPEHGYDSCGESVGFFRFSPDMSARLADRCAWYVERGDYGREYEDAIRDLILAFPGRFAAVDIGDLAWTEIDFPIDVVHANRDVLPRVDGQSASRAFSDHSAS